MLVIVHSVLNMLVKDEILVILMKQESNFLNCKIWILIILITLIIVYRIQFELRKQYSA